MSISLSLSIYLTDSTSACALSHLQFVQGSHPEINFISQLRRRQKKLSSPFETPSFVCQKSGKIEAERKSGRNGRND